MIVIGITGTLGAGKGTIVEYLVDKCGFKHFSVREFINKKIVDRGLKINRDNMVLVANDLRKKYGPSYLVEEIYKRAVKQKKNCVIESLRTPAEINSLKAKSDFYLFAIDADIKTRYKRIKQRYNESDNVTFAKFISDEKREMQSKDPTKQNLKKCILMADYRFDNNDTIKKLYEKVEKVITKIC